MSKRTAEQENEGPLKGGDRPEQMDVDSYPKDMGEFEDEFEDEFESEDEILEAGVDGRPDAEREADEKGEQLCASPSLQDNGLIVVKMRWRSTDSRAHSWSESTSWNLDRSSHRI